MRLTTLPLVAAFALAGCMEPAAETVGNGQPFYTPDPSTIPDSALAALPADAPLSAVVAQNDLPGSPGGPCYYYDNPVGGLELLNCIM